MLLNAACSAAVNVAAAAANITPAAGGYLVWGVTSAEAAASYFNTSCLAIATH